VGEADFPAMWSQKVETVGHKRLKQ